MAAYSGAGAETAGNDNCLMCHPDYDPSGKLNHAAYFDCETCHGPGSAHMGVASGILHPAKMPTADSNNICVMCHQIRGSTAGGRLGPDLTHVGRRATIAAGTLPMTPEDLDSWIADPQAVNPGVSMPKVDLSPEDRRSIVAYLGSLK